LISSYRRYDLGAKTTERKSNREDDVSGCTNERSPLASKKPPKQ
jgi:hypothetical protein